MSRTKCPHCGKPVILYGKLKKYEYGGPANAGVGAKFNHAKAEDMFKQGKSLSAIAQRFKVEVTSVRQMLERKGLEVRKGKP